MSDVVQNKSDTGQVDPKDLVAFSCLIIGAFLALLDIQIIASSMGALSASLGATIEEVAWVQSAYLTAEIIVIPLSAWLTKTFSTRNVVLVATAGFAITSVACACAWDLPSMVFFRVLQGLFGGVLIPIMLGSVYILFPPKRQTTAIAAVGFVLMFPNILGPILGGWITELASWHWIFLMNVPLCIGMGAGAYATINFDRPNYNLLRRVDILGIVLIALFLASAEFVLKEGTKYDWFESTLIFRLTTIAICSFLLLIWWELTTKDPVVNLRLFANSQFTLGCTLSFLTGFVLFVPTFLLPAILSTVRDFNSLQIGSVMVVTGFAAALSGIAVGLLEKRLDLRALAVIGFGITAFGMWIDSDLTHEVGYDQLFWGQACRGMGMIFMFIPCSTAALGFLKEEDVGNGSGLFNLMRNLGGAVGLSLVTWMMQTRQDLHYQRISEVVTEGRTAFDMMTNEPTSEMRLESVLPSVETSQTALTEMAMRLAEREALVMTFNDLWIFVTCILAMSFLFIPFLRKPAEENNAAMAH